MLAAGLNFYVIAIPAGLLILFSIAECLWPRSKRVLGRFPRWRTHALFFLTNAALGRLLALFIVVGSAATWSAANEFGLLYQSEWPWWIEACVGFLLLDLAVWVQHWAMHRSHILWRVHKVHHSDRDLDATTALRFHPFELLISTFFKSACVALLGIPVLVALAFEVWLNCNALFNHSNIRLPSALDRALRIILVTPDMHLVHHSTNVKEQYQNYGFALTWWDRIFGTYAYQPTMDRDQQTVGLENITDDRPAQFMWSMKQPLT